MARRKIREEKPRQELSDLIHGNWEALHHTIGSLLPATMYALSLKAMETANPELSGAEAVAAGLAGSFAIRYADTFVNFLLPEMQRESYIRKNQREIVKTVARATTAVVAGTFLSYVTDAPFLYTAALSIASFMTGKTAARKMPEMKYSMTIPTGTLLLGSCLHLSLSGVASTATMVKENVIEQRDETTRVEQAQEPQIEYTAKPPFTTWPVESDWKQVNSCFGYRSSGRRTSVISAHHKGIDIQASWHTPVLSVGNGTVVDVHQKGGIVQIDHGEGIFTEYGHLDVIYVKPGNQLLTGERIGLSGGRADGKNGRSTGPHLHFMIIDEGVSPYLQDTTGNAAVLKGKVNPLCYMDEDIGFKVAKESGCNTQGGKNKYCGLYKSPLELVIDIEQKYGEIVRAYVDPAKMDPGMIYALIAQESRGVLDAGSKQGAYGPMQFIPPTAVAYGLCDNEKCKGRDDRADPNKSIAAGVAYYERIQEQFKDYTEKDIFTIAAYNAGSELIRRAIEKTEWSDPTWDQVAVMITQDLIADVYGTKNGMKSIDAREKKALEIKNHVSNVKGYYSFYLSIREQNRSEITEDTDTVRIKDQ